MPPTRNTKAAEAPSGGGRADLLQDSPRVAAQRARMEAAYTPAVQRQPAPNGMPADLVQGIEALSGQNLGDVRLHRSSPEPKTIGAHAFAVRDDIHLGPGQDHHLPHEAWHVVQQRQSRVAPTGRLGGVSINTDPQLEREADTKGAEAVRVGTRETDGG
ncbi:DUF4157 domain-containing protein [uncultured Roseobacter sp.]|uniref:eCIS core domain-containing protein n=1 Tax=uncultured Roseobacter sp. TaxID=114847 RepID=UPI002620F371|nr:DUF4157 domain-containing protein [uncultured Roseobacter sp.]